MIGGLFQGLGAAGGGFATALRDIMERERMREYQNAQIGLRAEELAFRRDQASEQKARWEAEHNRPQMANIHGIPTPVDDWRTADTAWHEQHPEPAPKLTGPAGRTYVDTPEGFDRLLADRRAWTAAGRAPEAVAPDGGPPAPQVTDLPVGVQQAIAGAAATTNALDRYEQLAGEYMNLGRMQRVAGKMGVPNRSRDEMVGELQTAQRNVQINAKELANLGVLNGPDMDLLNDIIGDPLSTESIVRDPSYMFAKLREARAFIDGRMKAYQDTYGIGGATSDPIPVSRFGRLKGMGHHPENPYQ